MSIYNDSLKDRDDEELSKYKYQIMDSHSHISTREIGIEGRLHEDNMRIPELLAPVGSMDHLKVAINAGASSVYLSGKEYGARRFAENFTLNEIPKQLTPHTCTMLRFM